MTRASRWRRFPEIGRLVDLELLLTDGFLLYGSHLPGGLGKVRTTSSHGPFIHLDTRGYRARW